jgi:hypothetical protein
MIEQSLKMDLVKCKYSLNGHKSSKKCCLGGVEL